MSDLKPYPAEPILPGTERYASNDPCGETHPAYRTVFQAWVVLFLLVVCVSLLIYLTTFVPGLLARLGL